MAKGFVAAGFFGDGVRGVVGDGVQLQGGQGAPEEDVVKRIIGKQHLARALRSVSLSGRPGRGLIVTRFGLKGCVGDALLEHP